MARPYSFMLAGVFAAGLSTAAQAADLLPPMAEAPHHPVAIGSGWYLRGDVGVANYESSTWTQPATNNGSTILSSGFIQNEVQGGAVVAVGAGYQFNNWFRADVTGEYRSTVGLRGTYQETSTFLTGLVINNFAGQNVYNGNLASWALMFNGYIDLGTWNCITPFIGGGVGYAYHRMHGFSDSGYASINGAVFPVAVNLVDEHKTGNLAWSLQAGLAYDVTQNVKLELSYRYINFGDVKSGVIRCGTLSGCGTAAPGFTVKNLEAQEIKVGMRWLLDGKSYAEAPAPIMRKY